jgi:hypothetical protein
VHTDKQTAKKRTCTKPCVWLQFAGHETAHLNNVRNDLTLMQLATSVILGKHKLCYTDATQQAAQLVL